MNNNFSYEIEPSNNLNYKICLGEDDELYEEEDNNMDEEENQIKNEINDEMEIIMEEEELFENENKKEEETDKEQKEKEVDEGGSDEPKNNESEIINNKGEENFNYNLTYIKACSNEEILPYICSDDIINNEQLDKIFTQIKENILNNNYTGKNTIIQRENVAIQISTLEDQKNNNNQNISSIDLVECEDILKTHYKTSNNKSIIVVKTDIKNEDLSSIYVQYELYDPDNLTQLNLDLCKDVKIIINVPVDLDEDTISLYDSLSQFGYNLFDSKDAFYNDICTTYTSQNGTDMILTDRQKEIYSVNGNISLCQNGCEFELYDSNTKKAKCNCNVQTESTNTDIEKINYIKKL